MTMPGFRVDLAVQNGVERRMMFYTWGGIGDQICSEPTLRHAVKTFKNCEVFLASQLPALFSHLKFERVFDLKDKDQTPNEDNFLVFPTITPPDDSNMVWQFFSHMLTNCVDFPSLCALRSQLPIAEKEIYLCPEAPEDFSWQEGHSPKHIFVHAGKHWPSKTFPKDWWDAVLAGLVEAGAVPVLIGADSDTNKTTVNVDTKGCIDLRNKMSLDETIWTLQRARVLLTNDSSPLHMAASRDPKHHSTGRTWIGYVATCKHPDYITHWRSPHDWNRAPTEPPLFQWREENLGLGGMWDITDHAPNSGQKIEVGEIDEATLRTWLPEPAAVVKWALEKYDGN
jgi:hypothetical protein